MRAKDTLPRFISPCFIIAAILLAPAIGLGPVRAAVIDPLANGPVDPDLFTDAPAAKPDQPAGDIPQQHPRQDVRTAHFQPNNQTPFGDDAEKTLPAPSGPVASSKDPCAAVANKPLTELGISIAEPAGKLPTDLATPCWNQINGQTGGNVSARCWPVVCYTWEATCFYHNPLYFEEVNLERYGYQCGDRSCCCSCGRECCLQPAASAAHFFGTIPLLPYCMANECPGDCIYTLGHYRPGDCNPWRWCWPPCDPVAAAAQGGFWVGMIAAFP
jgi:hypothetical protein